MEKMLKFMVVHADSSIPWEKVEANWAKLANVENATWIRTCYNKEKGMRFCVWLAPSEKILATIFDELNISYESIIEVEETVPDRKKVIEQTTAFLITNLLEGVVQYGTGFRVKALNRPVAGKTGTTNNLFDAWFMGYTTRYITGVWVGFDDEAPLGKGETGSRAASPIWLGFMQRVLEGKPVEVFPVPEGIVFTKIDAETGLLPIPESKKTVFVCFKEGTVPTDSTKRPGEITEADDFFKKDL